ncbi:hypothetical protein LV163_000069 [Aspergillus fumigatus]|nr:hypothetical protein LV163_000069 [Aspergillus fumigatus]
MGVIPPEEPIDLFRGWPNPALLPTSALAQASATVLSTPSIRTPALLYGPDDGYLPLRKSVAEWLTHFYKPRDPVGFDRICITGGASQNLACIFQVFTDPSYTRHVWMVAPAYHLASRMVDDAGFAGRVRAVPQDDAGLDLDYLRREMEAAERKANEEQRFEPKHKPPRPWGKIYKHLIYATPTFSNPTTRTMSLSDREQLVQLAREFDALIVTDDVYDFLQWSVDPDCPLAAPDEARVPRLVDIDRYMDGGPQDEWGNVISNGSFSKLIGPGMRTGWAEGTAKLAYGLSQTYHVMMSSIRKHLLPLGVGLPDSSEVVGGYFIWVRLPSPLRAADIVQLAQKTQNLRVAAGEIFQIPGDSVDRGNDFHDFLRLCFAWSEEDQLAEGVRRLGCVIHDALVGPAANST